ncbi:MAG: 2Fe-2S iron-sulfur cluster binding domain-containing protein [Methylococcales bacterium]|jgi:CDP-4-dehydro-6-deoxyglucose reductase, E3|nr:2Fe-2S iron-sulfur cluster binding domain-containing protein [Methylococcales bacterium]MBT7408931.1 2Fe-2S iron-sulfur cluster binding domain-containing protein [Methylococcales bacterium]
MKQNNIQIKSSGHQFSAYQTESILDAGLNAGIALDYNCSNGSCGRCKAIVLEGKIEHLRKPDYRFSKTQQTEQQVLLCCVSAASDLTIETIEAHSSVDIPYQTIDAKVIKLEKLNENHLILHLRTPRSKTLRFLAGQHVQISFSDEITRYKAVASCPTNGMNLQFHVRKNDDNFSDYIFEKAKKSQKVTLEGPVGEFTLHEDATRPIMMLAYETGFAPIKSLMESLVALEFTQPIHLYWFVSQSQGLYLDKFCHAWNDVMEKFKYSPILEENLENHSLKESVLITKVTDIFDSYDDLASWNIYMTAPHSKTAELHRLFSKWGISDSHYRLDMMESI